MYREFDERGKMNNKDRDRYHEAFINNDKSKSVELLKKELSCSLIKFCNGAYDMGKNIYLDTLRESKIWLSSPHYLNDPSDCVMNIDYQSTMQKQAMEVCESLFGFEIARSLLNNPNSTEIIKNAADKVRGKLADEDRVITDNVFLACFSEQSNISSLRMWGYYANSHRGFCLEYDIEKILKTIDCMPVAYKKQYSLSPDTETDKEIRDFTLKIAYTKALEWQYEKEWRILEPKENQRGKNGYYIEFIKPSKVYCGCKADRRLINDLKEICEDQKIDLYEMSMRPGSFELVFSPLYLQ